jgi:hypothetical protein
MTPNPPPIQRPISPPATRPVRAWDNWFRALDVAAHVVSWLWCIAFVGWFFLFPVATAFLSSPDSIADDNRSQSLSGLWCVGFAVITGMLLFARFTIALLWYYSKANAPP